MSFQGTIPGHLLLHVYGIAHFWDSSTAHGPTFLSPIAHSLPHTGAQTKPGQALAVP